MFAQGCRSHSPRLSAMSLSEPENACALGFTTTNVYVSVNSDASSHFDPSVPLNSANMTVSVMIQGESKQLNCSTVAGDRLWLIATPPGNNTNNVPGMFLQFLGNVSSTQCGNIFFHVPACSRVPSESNRCVC